MSIDTLTGDEFMHLDAATHRVALDQYDTAIDNALAEASGGLPADSRRRHLDRLTGLLSLRKLHLVRLDELEEEELLPAPRTALERYRQNELDLLPS